MDSGFFFNAIFFFLEFPSFFWQQKKSPTFSIISKRFRATECRPVRTKAQLPSRSVFDSGVTPDPCGSQVKLALSPRPVVSGRRVEWMSWGSSQESSGLLSSNKEAAAPLSTSHPLHFFPSQSEKQSHTMLLVWTRFQKNFFFPGRIILENRHRSFFFFFFLKLFLLRTL